MIKWKMSKRTSAISNPRAHFYPREILPDFQKRSKTIELEKKNIPEAVHDHVGMDTINATTNSGRYFVEFASSATIHGLNHLVAPHRHFIEKFLAVLFILGALCGLFFLSFTFWGRYQDDATVIVIDNDHRNFKIRKPSYIVRPIDNFKLGNVSHIFEAHGVEYTKETEDFFRFLSGVTYDNMLDTPRFDRVPSSKWLALLYDLRLDIPTNILKLKNQYVNGEWIITERGFCLAFRSNVRIYASFEYWMQNNFTVVPPPKEIPYYDYDSSPSDTEAISLDYPIMVSYNDPNDMIEFKTPVISIYTRIMYVEKLQLQQLVSTDEVCRLSIHQRNCKIPHDGGLSTWPIYTPGMCSIECRMQYIQSKCGCRPHFARPISDVPVCNAEQLRCVGEVKQAINKQTKLAPNCGCLPKCHVVVYQKTETFMSELKDGTPTNTSLFRTSVDFPIITYQHTVLFGFNSFLTAVGGGAGLFLGGSVLSFVEIFYYVTLRLFSYMITLRKRNRKKEAQSQKIWQLN